VAGRVRRSSLILVFLVILAGCGSSTPTAAPDGFTARRVDRPQFSIALPQRWHSFDAESHAEAKSAVGDCPRLRAELDVLGRADSPIKLIGIAPTAGGGFVTNMSVLQTRVPASLSFEQLARNEARQIELAAHAKEMRQSETKLPAGRALRLRYRTPASAVVHQYFVRHGDFLYIVTYTTSAAAAGRYAQTFERSAQTFSVE
jgi:hypothetical protein